MSTARLAFQAAHEAARLSDIAAGAWSVMARIKNVHWEGHPQAAIAMEREANYGDAADEADEVISTWTHTEQTALALDCWGQGEASELADRLACYQERRDAKASTIANYYKKTARAWRRQARAILAIAPDANHD